ncbi:unnamed protein product [Owenia fusiformis]|uniref:Uncharacterized protein n=1 Tax=Owenia fusiformis TaxID=6347 RepID=A0A8S4PJ33_OWEFU|nr:unnamed protein product [Owenia fusiformis]
MPAAPPKGWVPERVYRCLAQFVSKQDWELHRSNAHLATVACGVGDCSKMFIPTQVEELAFHRRRHLNLGAGEEVSGEPSRKRKREEGDGTGQELGVDPASISTPKLQAFVHPQEEQQHEEDNQPQTRGLRAESVGPILGKCASDVERLLRGPGADLGDVNIDNVDIDELLNLV